MASHLLTPQRYSIIVDATDRTERIVYALTYIDADRMNRPAPGNGEKHVNYRTRFAVALLLLFALWLFFRLNHYFVR